jgi:hypothetical protein
MTSLPTSTSNFPSYNLPSYHENLTSRGSFHANGEGPIGISFDSFTNATPQKTKTGIEFSGMTTGGMGNFDMSSMAYQKAPIDPVYSQSNIGGGFGGNAAIKAKTYSEAGAIGTLNTTSTQEVDAMAGPHGGFSIGGDIASSQWL